MRPLKTVFILSILPLLTLFLQPPFCKAFGVNKKRVKAQDFGNVAINNFSQKNNIAPVVFPHWLHRAKYTCRLCHVDLDFSMKANDTQMTEADNTAGMFCGACHNGSEAFAPETVDASGRKTSNCHRCHSLGKQVEFKYDFFEFIQELPRERFGNGVNWQKAEEEKRISVKDFLPGVSIKQSKMKEQNEFDIASAEPNMPKIIFSHKKHAAWNGCGMCHPEVFDIKRGGTSYTMQAIFAGKYCGMCHGLVAFPSTDCRRCHTEPVY